MQPSDVLSKTIWLSIEGNISSGKTTLITFLKSRRMRGDDFGYKGYDVYFVDEDLDAWGPEIFKHYYENPKRWAFTFQFKVIAIRAKQLREIREKIRESGRPGIVISERSMESSRYVFMKMCTDSGNVNTVEKDTYEQCYDIMTDFIRTDFYLYCSTPPELCEKRYLKRAREGETLDLDYLRSCHEKHTEWLVDRNVIKLDTSEDATEENLTKWYDQIVETLHRV